MLHLCSCLECFGDINLMYEERVEQFTPTYDASTDRLVY